MSVNAVNAGHAYVIISAIDQTGKVLDRIHARMSSFGTQMMAMGAALLAPFAAGVRVGTQFDDQIRELGAVSDAADETAASLAELRQQAKDLGKERGIAPVDVARVQTELARAGFTRAEVGDMTPAVLNLSRASRTDPGVSAEILGSTMRQFQLDSSEAARVADVLALAANKSAISVEDLGHSLKYAGPLAASLGMSLEELTAMVAVLGNLGIKADMAGTALRNIAVRSAADREKFGEFGIETTDAKGDLLRPSKILQNVIDKSKGMGTADRTEMIAKLFGLRGMIGAMPLVNSGISDIGKFQKDLEAAAGSAQKAAEAIDGGLGGAFRRLMAAVKVAGIDLQEALEKPLIDLAVQGLKAIEWITEFIKQHPQAVVGAAKFGAALLAIGAASMVLGSTVKAIGLVVGAFGLLMNPITAIPIALAAATAAFFLMGGEWSKVLDTMTGRFDQFQRHVNDGWEDIPLDILEFLIGGVGLGGQGLGEDPGKAARIKKALGAEKPKPGHHLPPFDPDGNMQFLPAGLHAMGFHALPKAIGEEVAKAVKRIDVVAPGPLLEAIDAGGVDAARAAHENRVTQELAKIAKAAEEAKAKDDKGKQEKAQTDLLGDIEKHLGKIEKKIEDIQLEVQ